MDQLVQTLIEHLREPNAYPHDVDPIQLRETHISWIFLTGPFAYKVKKPVRTGFLDFSTLELRRHFCQEELRLNSRFAPQLYLEVVPITGRPATPHVGGDGDPIEFAVKMRQFSEKNLLTRLLQEERLVSAHINQLAEEVGRFHLAAVSVGARQPFGTPRLVHQEAIDNLTILKQLLPAERQTDLPELRRVTEQLFGSLENVFQARRNSGSVRECHGDLHLGNLVLLDGRVTLFDGIEFNEEFRWIDVMSDAAFVIMDLADRRRADLAHRFLGRYLETTGDYDGLAVLDWYVIYRALVRAKVASIRASQEEQQSETAAQRTQTLDECSNYIQLAKRVSNRPCAELMITSGVSGSGKTTGTEPIIEELGAVRVRSDVERKRLFNLKAADRSGSAAGTGIYTAEASQRTYERLADCARSIVSSGRTAIVDATFLHRHERKRFQRIAKELGVPFTIIPFNADVGTLEERLRRRVASGNDASEATAEILHGQLKSREPFSDEEQTYCRTVDEILEQCQAGA